MEEDKRKHLEFVQNIVTRMNSNSFLIKGWAVTLVSALFALAAKDANINYVLISYIPIPVFWGLDAYYLSQERQYRELYKQVVAGNVTNFVLNTSKYNEKDRAWVSCFFSKTILVFYIALVLVTVCVMFLFNSSVIKS